MSLRRSPPPKRTGMAKPSDVAPGTSPVPEWIKPSGTGTASSSQTTGRTPAPIGKTPKGPDPNPDNNETNPKPKDENKPPDGPPDDDPGNSGGGRGRRPKSGSQQKAPPYRQPDPQENVPKLKHTLKGAEDFAGWTKYLKLAL